ncbi:MAG: hypothetical protein ACK5RC_08585 [Curvibacter sp.]|jgi:hypothetical protein|nr:hypothetical protein [Curvibacter sp.]
MNSARKSKLKLKQHPPRNPMVVPARQRKAGSHRRTKKSERQAQQRALRKALQA